MISTQFRNQNYEFSDSIIALNKSRYRVLEQLGKGGNGCVFECEDVVTGELLALKIIFNLRYPRRERFEREIEIIRQLNHEHIVTYVTHGEISITQIPQRRGRNKKQYGQKQRRRDVPFIIMRKADHNLRDFLKNNSSSLRFEDYYGQFIGLSKALEKLHNIAVHRDIKPDNILISADVWQISDFGLCAFINKPEEPQLTRAEEAVGPRYWMSPEAVSKVMGLGNVINCCSDLFQLASVFWFVVTQRPPIGILTIDDWSGPPALGNLLIDTLQHNPSRRPQSITDFLARLEDVRFS